MMQYSGSLYVGESRENKMTNILEMRRRERRQHKPEHK